MSGIVNKEDLDFRRTGSFEHANAYQAVYCRNLRVLINEASKFGEYKCFVDIGAGKGKACFYAHYLNKFSSIIGVELSKQLIEIANKNLNISRAENVSFICCDAARFDLPQIKSIVFLFNPFDQVIMETFIRNNLETLRRNKSLIAYANNKHHDVLFDLGFSTVFKCDVRGISLHQLK